MWSEIHPRISPWIISRWLIFAKKNKENYLIQSLFSKMCRRWSQRNKKLILIQVFKHHFWTQLGLDVLLFWVAVATGRKRNDPCSGQRSFFLKKTAHSGAVNPFRAMPLFIPAMFQLRMSRTRGDPHWAEMSSCQRFLAVDLSCWPYIHASKISICFYNLNPVHLW